MRKILLGTSALLMAGCIVFTANAAPIKMNVGGYANWYTGFVDGNKVYEESVGKRASDFPVVGDVEISFSGETALANGLKFGAVVEVSSVAVKDQSFVYVDGSFGRVLMGKIDSISKQLHTASKDVGLLTSQASDISYLSGMSGSLSTDIRYPDGGTSIIYMSPKFSGFGINASYTEGDYLPSTNEADNSAIYMVTATYGGKVGKFDVATDLTYAKVDIGKIDRIDIDDDYSISVGLRIGMNGFTLGGGYKVVESKKYNEDYSAFDIGLAYEKGVYGASLSYIYGKAESDYREFKESLLLASVSYNVAAGIKAFSSFGYQTEEFITSSEIKAYVFVTGLGLTF